MRTAADIGVAKKLYDEARKPENQRRIKHPSRAATLPVPVPPSD